ncbi:glycosyl transferase family 1 [Limnochorda pilosa]|uniref:Glycosyl transferase family 1 n=2 Tax=Limnochorda pilosa TaxID=1555112 RepID=A0A0K2SJF9_LIMPI|nr:glycosyl transferase family 1 [Limnochorda pilosa]
MISDHGDPMAPPGGEQTGGQNVYVRELARHLGKKGVVVDVFTHWDDPDRPQVEYPFDGVRVIRLAAGKKGYVPKDRLLRHVPAFVSELGQMVRRDRRVGSFDRYHLIHSHYWISGRVGRLLKARTGLPQVHTSHSLGLDKIEHQPRAVDPSRLEEERAVVTHADAVVATSPPEVERLVEGYGAPRERIRVIPCGVDPDVFRPRPGQLPPGREPEELTLFFAGRFVPQKGVDVLGCAFARLARGWRGKPLRLVLAGGDGPRVPVADWSPQRRLLEQILRAGGVRDRVTFLGPVDQERLSLWFHAADVVAVPSRYESFGMVALEALASGAAVVASKVGGLSHTVKHGVSGLHVPPVDDEALAAALERLLSDEALRRRLRRGALRQVRREYAWQRIAAAMDALYQEVGTAWPTPLMAPASS